MRPSRGWTAGWRRRPVSLVVLLLFLGASGLLVAGGEVAAAAGFGFNEAPVAAFVYMPEFPTVGQSILFDASDSYDPNGVIVRYEWDFTGDGRFDASGVTASWTFHQPGPHAVTLYVVDDDNTATRLTQTVNVRTLSVGALEAQFDFAPERPRAGQLVTFDARGLAGGMAGGSAGTPGLLYEWDLDGDGVFESQGSIVQWRYDRDGVYRVTLRVSDGMGRMDQRSRVVQVGPGLVTVVLESEPSDLLVYIDGLEQGRTPLTLELEPRRHRLRIKHYWRGEWETDLDLNFVSELALRIVLR